MTVLLVEKYNNRRTSLIDYICSVKKDKISLSDEEIWEIRKSLSVHSLEEVVEHFQPEINIALGREQISIPICHRDGFFRQLIQLWETIQKGGYTDITKADLTDSLLAGDSVTENQFVEAQEQIFIYLQQGRLEKAQKQLKKCTELFNDTLFLTKRLIKQAQEYLQKNQGEHRRFVVDTNKESSLQCIAVSEAFRKSRYHTRQAEEQYQQLLEQMLQPKDRLLYWNMLLVCETLSEKKRGQLKLFWEEQTEVYQKAMGDFWRQAKPLIQTLFNCYCYFKSQKAEELLITNCTVEELSDTRYQRELCRYLETVNQKQYQGNRIHTAILPNIQSRQRQDKLMRQRFPTGKQEISKSCTNNLKAAQALQHTLEQYEIKVRLVMYNSGKPLGYALTGIDVEKMPDSKNTAEDKLRSLTIWLNELKLQGEE